MAQIDPNFQVYSDHTIHPIMKKLLSFKDLDNGWHYGQGKCPESHLIKIANRLLESAIFGSFETNVFPGIDGEIMVAVYHKDDYLEFIIETDEHVDFIHELDKHVVEEKYDISVSDALEELKKFRQSIWNNTLESSTVGTGTISINDSQALLLKTPHLVAEFQSYLKSVLIKQETISANMFDSSMVSLSHQNPLFFSNSTWKTYRMDVHSGNTPVAQMTNATVI